MNTPLVSLIIPVRNEEKYIAACMEAVLNQDYPPDRIEILVADGMSTDRTVSIIQGLPGGDRIHIIPNPRGIQTAGMNEAIRQAHGDILMRIDGHTLIAPDYVRQCVRILNETGAQSVGGPMNPIGLTPMGKAIAAAGKSVFAVPTPFHVSNKAQYTDTVYLGAWPRQVFDQVGLFSETLDINNDYELNYRIRRSGGKIYLSPEIHSQYIGRQTLRGLALQYYRYGQAKLTMLHDNPGSVHLRHLAAPAFVALLIIGPIVSSFIPTFIKLWLLILATYGLADLVFSLQVTFRNNGKLSQLGRLLIVFPTIHLAWGTGFLIGILIPHKAKPF